MPYYTGDYYQGDNYCRGQGDYYRGDPGIFGSIAKAVGKVAGAALSFTPAGAIAKKVAGTALSLLGGGGRPPGMAIATQGMGPASASGVGIGYFAPGGGGVGIGSFPQFGIPTPGQLPPGFALDSNGRLCAAKGTRLNKSGYYKQVEKGNPFVAVYVPPKSVCVKTRRLNIANPRALRRAVRRAQGFAKMARRVMTFVSAKAPKGRARFKRKG